MKPAWAAITNPRISTDLQKVGGLTTYLAIFWRTAYVLAGLLLLVYLIYGGLTWLTSSGDKEGLEKAKKVMTSAVIGITILAISFPIIKIAELVLGVDILTPLWPEPTP